MQKRGCKIDVSSDFVKHSSNFGIRGVVFKAFLECSFWAKCAENLVIYNAFDIFDIDFVQKHWFLQHYVGAALCSPRGPEANFDECLRKSKETDAPSVAPETQLTSEIRDRATTKQSPSNRRATAEQPPSNRRATAKQPPSKHFTNPYPSRKILLKKNLEQRRQDREDRTEKTEHIETESQ